MRDKAPSFFNGISFQLAKIGIILAFVLSFLLSSVQLYLDFLNLFMFLLQFMGNRE